MCVQAAQKQNVARVAPPLANPNKEITLYRQKVHRLPGVFTDTFSNKLLSHNAILTLKPRKLLQGWCGSIH